MWKGYATLGVKQGSPTSCILFILYVDELIKTIKKTHVSHGFLGWLQLLMLMDDTIIVPRKTPLETGNSD